MIAKKQKLVVAVVAAMGVLVLAGCQKARAQDAGAPKAMPAPQVRVITLTAQDIELTTKLSGRTSAFYQAEVRPQVGGIVEKRLFKEGSMVKAGQPLYQIEDATYIAQVESAKATLLQAQANHTRAQLDAKRGSELVKVKAISIQENDALQASLKATAAQVAAAKAALDAAKVNLEYTKVRAPISGRISYSQITEGALVQPYTTHLTNIQQLDHMYVDVEQTADQILKIRREIASGQLQTDKDGSVRVKLYLSDGTVYGHEGKLSFTDVVINEQTNSVNVRAEFPNPDGILMPGMYVNAEIAEGVREGGLLVQQQSVIRDGRGNASVMVVTADNKVEARPVKLGQTVGTAYVVDSGLQVGDKVIFSGIMRARPGATVDPKELDPAKLQEAHPVF